MMFIVIYWEGTKEPRELGTTMAPEKPICNSAAGTTWKITSILSRWQHMFSHKKCEGYSGKALLSTDSL